MCIVDDAIYYLSTASITHYFVYLYVQTQRHTHSQFHNFTQSMTTTKKTKKEHRWKCVTHFCAKDIRNEKEESEKKIANTQRMPEENKTNSITTGNCHTFKHSVIACVRDVVSALRRVPQQPTL